MDRAVQAQPQTEGLKHNYGALAAPVDFKESPVIVSCQFCGHYGVTTTVTEEGSSGAAVVCRIVMCIMGCWLMILHPYSSGSPDLCVNTHITEAEVIHHCRNLHDPQVVCWIICGSYNTNACILEGRSITETHRLLQQGCLQTTRKNPLDCLGEN